MRLMWGVWWAGREETRAERTRAGSGDPRPAQPGGVRHPARVARAENAGSTLGREPVPFFLDLI